MPAEQSERTRLQALVLQDLSPAQAIEVIQLMNFEKLYQSEDMEPKESSLLKLIGGSEAAKDIIQKFQERLKTSIENDKIIPELIALGKFVGPMCHFFQILLNQPEGQSQEEFEKDVIKMAQLKGRIKILWSKFKIGIDDITFDQIINSLKQTIIKDFKGIPQKIKM